MVIHHHLVFLAGGCSESLLVRLHHVSPAKVVLAPDVREAAQIFVFVVLTVACMASGDRHGHASLHFTVLAEVGHIVIITCRGVQDGGGQNVVDLELFVFHEPVSEESHFPVSVIAEPCLPDAASGVAIVVHLAVQWAAVHGGCVAVGEFVVCVDVVPDHEHLCDDVDRVDVFLPVHGDQCGVDLAVVAHVTPRVH